MSVRSTVVRKEENGLLIYYRPEFNFETIVERIKEDGTLIKGTFQVTESDIIKIDYDEEIICFKIANEDRDYYCLNQNVFDIEHRFFIEKNLNITDKWFVTYPRKSIIRNIDNLIYGDVYIVSDDDGCENHIPYKAFEDLLNVFPNSYEINKYVAARIAYLLSNYVEGIWKYKEGYDKYLVKKETRLTQFEEPSIKKIGFEMYKIALENLEKMLANPEPYSEKIWQEKIYQIICVLYPKYIAAFREIEIGTDKRHMKKPDFLLVDSAGFIDLLEIKKPDKLKVISTTEYRNNYVAGRDLEGAIVQIEKYVYILNHEGENRVEKICNKISDNLPARINIQVVNPQGILLLGRSCNLTEDQKFDFEIIKRQHKNIVDIMTYDDLIDRLRNILKQMGN